MFEAKMSEVSVLKKIVEAIKDIVNVVNIEVGLSGFSFQAMDLSHVALVSLSLKPDCFQSFNCENSTHLGIKLQNLHKILKCADSTDIITMSCDNDPQQLNFKFESQRHDKLSQFTLNLMMQEDEQLQIPSTTYSSRITMPSAEFARIVRELSQLSEGVKITTSKKSITFTVNSEVVNGEMELRGNNSDKIGEQIRIDVDEPVSNSFSLNFLNSFTKATSLSESVNLFLSDGTPLVVEYQIGDTGSLKYYLAPKMSED